MPTVLVAGVGPGTKIHALTDAVTRPLNVLLSPGRAGDNRYLIPLLNAHAEHSPSQEN